MQTSSSRALALVALGGALTLVGCGSSSEISPVAPLLPATSLSDNGGSLRSDGYGPGSGTCTNECDGTRQGPGNGPGPGPGPSNGLCGNACVGPVGPDPDDIAAILERALQEEYVAEMLYRHVLATFGHDTRPFASIAEAETRHVDALKVLLTRRNLASPPWAPVSFPAFGTIPEACAAGVAAEVADAAFYTPYLARTDLPPDVRQVFENLQTASLAHHLPAFEQCN